MTTQNTQVLKKVLLQSNLVGASEIVTMPSTNLSSNTFASPNGALQSPNWPSNYPSDIVTWTVFPAIFGTFRIISGTINVANTDHLRVYAGNGIDGPILYDATSSSSGSSSDADFVFCSGINQEFTVSFRSTSALGSGFRLDVRGHALTGSLSEVGEIRNDNGTLYGRDSLGTFNLRQANKSNADVQTFTANGTWTKPATASIVRVFLIGGGGGGGSGRCSQSGTAAGGGGGGAGGTIVQYATIPASVFGPTESVVVGTGGLGASSIAASDTNGGAGSSGGTSSFSSSSKIIKANGGAAGAGGTSVAGGAGGAGGSYGDSGVNLGGGQGAISASASAGAAGTFYSPGGGGGGGCITSGLLVFAGGNGGLSPLTYTAGSQTNAGAVTDNFTAGSPIQSNSGYGGVGSTAFRPRGGGGGGGGSPNAAQTVAGNGGSGGPYGGGGGGGSGALNGISSGAGGNGGDGVVVVVSW